MSEEVQASHASAFVKDSLSSLDVYLHNAPSHENPSIVGQRFLHFCVGVIETQPVPLQPQKHPNAHHVY